MPREILSITNLNLKIKKKLILDNINLKLYEGKILGIIGISGSGKSMLLKTITGFFKPNSGDIVSGQKNIAKQSIPVGLIGFSTQEDSIYENLSVIENIMYFGRLYKIKKLKERSEELLDLLNLREYKDTIAKKLSGGTIKRLNIACSLLPNPKILLLDEPISGLDPGLRENILSLISKIRESGTSIVITSHFINEIEPFCDRIAIVSQGQILTTDSPVNLREKYSNTYELTIRSHPGRYSRIHNIAKKELNVINAFIKNNELIMHVPKRLTINSYVRYLTRLLESNKEYPMKINVSQSPLNEIFRIITKNDAQSI